MTESIFRVLDANFNRAREGLRVLEDMSRFLTGDRALAAEFRRVRHALSKQVAGLCPRRTLLGHRDSGRDPGRLYPVPGRRSLGELAAANGCRVAEALRVLEEMAGLLGGGKADLFRDTRFRFYGAEKKLSAGLCRRLPENGFYAFLRRRGRNRETLELARRALEIGARTVHLENRPGTESGSWSLARALRRETSRAGAFLVIGGRLDIALACEADGFYADRSATLPADRARRLCPDRALGVEIARRAQIKQALVAGADFIGLPDGSTAGPGDRFPGVGIVAFGARSAADCRRLIALGADFCALEPGPGGWPADLAGKSFRKFSLPGAFRETLGKEHEKENG